MRQAIMPFIFLGCLTSVATAEPHPIAKAARPCWSVPAQVWTSEVVYNVQLNVTFDSDGKPTDVNVISFEPDNENVRLAVTSFTKAIERCLAGGSDYRGNVEFDMPSIEEAFKEDEIDPFKGK